MEPVEKIPGEIEVVVGWAEVTEKKDTKKKREKKKMRDDDDDDMCWRCGLSVHVREMNKKKISSVSLIDWLGGKKKTFGRGMDRKKRNFFGENDVKMNMHSSEIHASQRDECAQNLVMMDT